VGEEVPNRNLCNIHQLCGRRNNFHNACRVRMDVEKRHKKNGNKTTDGIKEEKKV
jgi:hypothetical protein